MQLRSVLRRLGISLASLLLLGGAFEVVARIAEPGPFSLLDSNPYIRHPALGHAHRPSFEGRWDGTWYATNSLGFRGPEPPSEALDPSEAGAPEFRVVCLGDSCTFGKGVAEADTWPRQFEGLLQEELGSRARARVFNLGVNGYSGGEYRTSFLEQGVELEPDLVVVGYNLNDFPSATQATDQAVHGQRGLRRALPRRLRDTLGRLAAYRFARASFYDLNRRRDWGRAERFARMASQGTGSDEVWEAQGRFLSEIRDAAEAVGGEVLVMLFPYESQVYLDIYDDGPVRALGQVCEELGLPFLALEGAFRDRARSEDPPRELFLRGDRYHPRPEGYRLVGESVLAEAVERSWLPR